MYSSTCAVASTAIQYCICLHFFVKYCDIKSRQIHIQKRQSLATSQSHRAFGAIFCGSLRCANVHRQRYFYGSTQFSRVWMTVWQRIYQKKKKKEKKIQHSSFRRREEKTNPCKNKNKNKWRKRYQINSFFTPTNVCACLRTPKHPFNYIPLVFAKFCAAVVCCYCGGS